MPGGGTSDSDSSNNWCFRVQKITIGWVFREGFEFKDIKTILIGE